MFNKFKKILQDYSQWICMLFSFTLFFLAVFRFDIFTKILDSIPPAAFGVLPIIIGLLLGIDNIQYNKQHYKDEYIKKSALAKKTEEGFVLRNKWTLFSYNKKKDQILCYDLQNTEYNFEVKNASSYIINSTNVLPTYSYASRYSIENYPESIQDEILYLFKYATKYSDILNTMQKFKINVSIHTPDKTASENKKAKTYDIVDINNVTEKEIVNLPGVNIVQAKKAIKYREINGYFKTKEEFIEVIKPREHFVEDIKNSIVISEPKEKPNNHQNDEGRAVDF